jgi:hypothetical protein
MHGIVGPKPITWRSSPAGACGRRTPRDGLPADRIFYLDKLFGTDELIRLIQIALAGASGKPGS